MRPETICEQSDPSTDKSLPSPKPPSPRGSNGRQQLDALFSIAYEELRRLATAMKRSHPAATTTPSGLVNATWLRLARSLKLPLESELHCKHTVAQAMRHLLVEAARRRNAQKRGGQGVVHFMAFDEGLGVPVSCDKEVLVLHTALKKLARVNPRHAAMIECRFFGGMNVAETASFLKVAPTTVDRDWRAAKAWLASEIRRNR